MLNIADEQKDIDALKLKVKLQKEQALKAKEYYLETHGKKMPLPISYVVEGIYREDAGMIDGLEYYLGELEDLQKKHTRLLENAGEFEDLQDKYNRLLEHTANIEDILTNGPSVEVKDNKQSWTPTEEDLKRLGTDRSVN